MVMIQFCSRVVLTPGFSPVTAALQSYKETKLSVSVEIFAETSSHCPVTKLYIENQKHIPNFWIYDAFLLDKQLSIWRIVQNRCPFL